MSVIGHSPMSEPGDNDVQFGIDDVIVTASHRTIGQAAAAAALEGAHADALLCDMRKML